MKVREELDKELNRLLKDIIKKTDIPQDASVNEIFELAEKRMCLIPKPIYIQKILITSMNYLILVWAYAIYGLIIKKIILMLSY